MLKGAPYRAKKNARSSVITEEQPLIHYPRSDEILKSLTSDDIIVIGPTFINALDLIVIDIHFYKMCALISIKVCEA